MGTSRKRLRGEARDEQIRAQLAPLEPGERPRAVTVAAGVALVLAAANVVLYAAGYSIRGNPDGSGAAAAFTFAAIMLAAAVGMWQVRYWAVLGFQCLLAVTAVFAGLALLVASNLQAVVLSVLVLAGSGTLFWHLVRAMARIQAPRNRVEGHG